MDLSNQSATIYLYKICLYKSYSGKKIIDIKTKGGKDSFSKKKIFNFHLRYLLEFFFLLNEE